MLNVKKLSTPSLAVPVSELKEFLRIDHSLEDSRIETMIRAATSRLESACDNVFLPTNFLVTLDRFPVQDKNMWWDGTQDGSMTEMTSPAKHICIPIGPIQTVASVKTVSNDDVEFTMPASDYSVDTLSNKGRISLRMGAVWPATVLAPSNGVRIEVTAGLCADAASLPSDIKQAIMEFVAAIYEHRGDEFPEIPATALMLIEPYRHFKV